MSRRLPTHSHLALSENRVPLSTHQIQPSIINRTYQNCNVGVCPVFRQTIQTWLYLMDFGEALHCVNGDFPISHGHFGGHTGYEEAILYDMGP